MKVVLNPSESRYAGSWDVAGCGLGWGGGCGVRLLWVAVLLFSDALEGRPKVKDLGETSAMVFKLATEILPPDTILFMDNYFSDPKLIIALKYRRITVCETLKQNRENLPSLLVDMKKKFSKNISYGVLAAMVQE